VLRDTDQTFIDTLPIAREKRLAAQPDSRDVTDTAKEKDRLSDAVLTSAICSDGA
jgi:hypothetical protein